jgi:hypothetical protein
VHHHGQKVVGHYLVNYLEVGKIMRVSFFLQLVLQCVAALRVDQPLTGKFMLKLQLDK